MGVFCWYDRMLFVPRRHFLFPPPLFSLACIFLSVLLMFSPLVFDRDNVISLPVSCNGSWTKMALLIRIQVYGCIMRIRDFSAFCVDHDTSVALVLWNAISAGAEVEDLYRRC